MWRVFLDLHTYNEQLHIILKHISYFYIRTHFVIRRNHCIITSLAVTDSSSKAALWAQTGEIIRSCLWASCMISPAATPLCYLSECWLWWQSVCQQQSIIPLMNPNSSKTHGMEIHRGNSAPLLTTSSPEVLVDKMDRWQNKREMSLQFSLGIYLSLKIKAR